MLPIAGHRCVPSQHRFVAAPLNGVRAPPDQIQGEYSHLQSQMTIAVITATGIRNQRHHPGTNISRTQRITAPRNRRIAIDLTVVLVQPDIRAARRTAPNSRTVPPMATGVWVRDPLRPLYAMPLSERDSGQYFLNWVGRRGRGREARSRCKERAQDSRRRESRWKNKLSTAEAVARVAATPSASANTRITTCIASSPNSRPGTSSIHLLLDPLRK